MKLGSLLVATLVCSFVGVVACGESDEEKAAAEKAKTEAELQETFLDTYCQIILKCCNQVLKKSATDVAGCKAHIRAMDPVTLADKTARDACITQAKAVAPDPHFCPDFEHANTPACPDPSRAKQQGTKKPGEICDKVEECAPDFTGIVDCAQGICQLRVRGAEGDTPCDTTVDGDVVLRAAQPSTEPKVFTCYRGGTDGTQCDLVTNTCIKALEDRAKCEGSSQCAKDEYCDTAEKRCFPKLVKNSKCDVDDECKGHCKIEDEDKGGFCEDPLPADSDCDATSWCEDGLECSSGKCTEPAPDARLAASCTP